MARGNLVPLATSCYGLNFGTKGPPSISRDTKDNNTGIFFYRSRIRAKDVRDGLSKVFLVGEIIQGHTGSSGCLWSFANRFELLRATTNPPNTPVGDGIVNGSQNGAFQSDHAGIVLFAFGDGHVSAISDNIDLATYRTRSTRAGDETLLEEY